MTPTSYLQRLPDAGLLRTMMALAPSAKAESVAQNKANGKL